MAKLFMIMVFFMALDARAQDNALFYQNSAGEVAIKSCLDAPDAKGVVNVSAKLQPGDLCLDDQMHIKRYNGLSRNIFASPFSNVKVNEAVKAVAKTQLEECEQKLANTHSVRENNTLDGKNARVISTSAAAVQSTSSAGRADHP